MNVVATPVTRNLQNAPQTNSGQLKPNDRLQYLDGITKNGCDLGIDVNGQQIMVTSQLWFDWSASPTNSIRIHTRQL